MLFHTMTHKRSCFCLYLKNLGWGKAPMAVNVECLDKRSGIKLIISCATHTQTQDSLCTS